MSLREIVVAVLVVGAVALALMSTAGVLLMRDALDRVHYTAPAMLGGVCAAMAIVVAGGPSLIATRAILLAAVLLATAPVLAHATGRAIHDHEQDR